LYHKIDLLLSGLHEQLNFVDLEIDNEIKRSEKAIEIIQKQKKVYEM
jgi:hypothetical protein